LSRHHLEGGPKSENMSMIVKLIIWDFIDLHCQWAITLLSATCDYRSCRTHWVTLSFA